MDRQKDRQTDTDKTICPRSIGAGAIKICYFQGFKENMLAINVCQHNKLQKGEKIRQSQSDRRERDTHTHKEHKLAGLLANGT